MSDQGGMDKEALRKKLYPLVVSQVHKGASTESIIGRLEKAGFSRQEAEEMISLAMNDAGPGAPAVPAAQTSAAAPAATEIPEQVAAQALHPEIQTGILMPVVGGLASAIIGGGVWGALAVLTDREFGIIAWGMGALCAIAVLFMGKGRKGLAVQATAIACSLLGIVLGKFITFVWAAKHLTEADGLTQEALEVFQNLPYTSLKWPFYFIFGLPSMLNPYDLLWVGLAVYTAWKILRHSEVTVTAKQA